MWNFHGSWFLALKIPIGCNKILWNFEGEASFCLEFQRLNSNLKIPAGVFLICPSYLPYPPPPPLLVYHPDVCIFLWTGLF